MIDDKRHIAEAKKCPLCGQPNNCEVGSGSDCWCFSETISKGLLLSAGVLSAEKLNTKEFSAEGIKTKALGYQVSSAPVIYDDNPVKSCICQCCVRGFDS